MEQTRATPPTSMGCKIERENELSLAAAPIHILSFYASCTDPHLHSQHVRGVQTAHAGLVVERLWMSENNECLSRDYSAFVFFEIAPPMGRWRIRAEIERGSHHSFPFRRTTATATLRVSSSAATSNRRAYICQRIATERAASVYVALGNSVFLARSPRTMQLSFFTSCNCNPAARDALLFSMHNSFYYCQRSTI